MERLGRVLFFLAYLLLLVLVWSLGLLLLISLGAAFAFAMGSAATALEDAPPLAPGAAAFLDAVFGFTSSICSTPLFGGGAAIISKVGLLAAVRFASAVDAAFGVAFNIAIFNWFWFALCFCFCWSR